MKAEPGQSAVERRVVLDSNVWISAALSRDSAPARVVRRVLERGVAVFSPETFAELEARLWRPKFDPWLGIELRQRILHDASAAAYWVDIPERLRTQAWCRDADDDKFVRTALAAEAVWLISGDRDLLEMPVLAGMRIVAPAEAVADPRFCA